MTQTQIAVTYMLCTKMELFFTRDVLFNHEATENVSETFCGDDRLTLM